MKKIKKSIMLFLIGLLLFSSGYCLATWTGIGYRETENHKWKNSILESVNLAESIGNVEECELEVFLEKYIYGKWRFVRRLGVKANDVRSEWSNHENAVDFTAQGAEEMTEMVLFYSKDQVAVVSGLDGTAFTNPIDMYLFGSSGGGLNSARHPQYKIMGSRNSNSSYQFAKGDDPYAGGSLIWVTYTAGNERDGEIGFVGNCVGDKIYVNLQDTETLYLDFCGFWELKREEKEPEPMDRGCQPDLTGTEKEILEEHVYGTWVFAHRLYDLEEAEFSISGQGVEEIVENMDIAFGENYEWHFCGQDSLSNPRDVYLYFAYGGGNGARCVWHVWDEADTRNIRLRNVLSEKDSYIHFKEKEKLVEVSYDLGYNAYENPSAQVYGFGSHLYIDPEDRETLYLDFCGLWELKRKDSAISIKEKDSIQKTEDLEIPFTIIRDEYNDQSKENDICISYPQIQGLGDTDKEERINELIRKGALRILCGERYERNELYCRLDYEIKFMNENIISICYKGLDGAAGKDRLHSVALTSTVDLKEGKIIRLDDIVKSLGTLADILLVIVHNFTSQYNEYSMDIKEAGNHILDDTFLKKINAEWGMQETEETTVAECTYENQYDGNFIRIYYPRIQNLGDEGKERRVNALIKKEVLALLNSLDIQKKEAYCFLEYEIKLMNESIFNVYYEGNYGAADSSIVHPFAAATAISLKEETVIALEDIITDRDMLEEMFSKGKFEEITVWGKNGETDGKEEEESYDGDEVCRIEKNDGWYVEENNFIVIRNGENFQKYLLGMEKMKKVLDGNFVDGIGCGDGDMEREKPYSSIRYEYHDRYQKNRVAIYYPQIRGLGDGNREKQVNALIREDALKLLYGTGYEKDELYCQLDYGIKFMGADMISIFYKGFDGVTGHDKIDAAAITTTVDLKEGKIITLNDIVADFDALTDMLLEDRFEDITMWEGMTGTEKISWKYGGKRKRLYEDLKREEYDRERDNIGWYTDGKKFIIVHDSMPGYHEYSIDMQEMKDILDKEC